MKRKIKFAMILFIIISSMYLVKTTNSRYISKINSNNSLDVAVPQITLDNFSMNTSELVLPGDSVECEFYIKNYENSKINEVMMAYYINLNITEQGIPLTYKIYEISGTKEIELAYNEKGFGPVTLNYGTEETKKYKIIFTWDKNNNSNQYANKQFSFNVKVNATQVI